MQTADVSTHAFNTMDGFAGIGSQDRPPLELRADDGRGILCVLVPLPTGDDRLWPMVDDLRGPWATGTHPKGRGARVCSALHRGRRVVLLGFRNREAWDLAEIVPGLPTDFPSEARIRLPLGDQETFVPADEQPRFLSHGHLRYGCLYQPTRRMGMETRVVWNIRPCDRAIIDRRPLSASSAIIWHRPALYRPEPPQALDAALLRG